MMLGFFFGRGCFGAAHVILHDGVKWMFAHSEQPFGACLQW